MVKITNTGTDPIDVLELIAKMTTLASGESLTTDPNTVKVKIDGIEIELT